MGNWGYNPNYNVHAMKVRINGLFDPYISRLDTSRKKVKSSNLLLTYDHFHGHPSNYQLAPS